MAARSGKLRVIPRSAVAPPLITTEQLRMMMVPVRILTVRNSVSTETVRKQYGIVLALRIALFTVIQGRPGRATFACTEAGGISRVALRLCRVALWLCRVALRLHYGLTIPWLCHGSFEHFKTFVAIAGPPRVSRDHEGS